MYLLSHTAVTNCKIRNNVLSNKNSLFLIQNSCTKFTLLQFSFLDATSLAELPVYFKRSLF